MRRAETAVSREADGARARRRAPDASYRDKGPGPASGYDRRGDDALGVVDVTLRRSLRPVEELAMMVSSDL